MDVSQLRLDFVDLDPGIPTTAQGYSEEVLVPRKRVVKLGPRAKALAEWARESALEVARLIDNPPSGPRRPWCPVCQQAPYPGEKCRCEATAAVEANKARRAAIAKLPGWDKPKQWKKEKRR